MDVSDLFLWDLGSGVMEYRALFPRSVRFEAGELDHLTPSLDIVSNRAP